MKKAISAAVSAAAIMTVAAPASAAFLVTVEDAGVQNTTTTFDYAGVETFDARSSGSFATDFGTAGVITGTYSGVGVSGANQYGGARGVGKFATTSTLTGYTLSLSQTGTDGVNYFGFWLSALDAGNQLEFYKAGALVYSFSPDDLIALVGGNSAYYGNPNSGANSAQPYAFVNFYDQGDTFDEIRYYENISNAGYESDNHTVGYYVDTSGTVVPGVPEPATWAMMILGFGLIGGTLRSRREKNALSAA